MRGRSSFSFEGMGVFLTGVVVVVVDITFSYQAGCIGGVTGFVMEVQMREWRRFGGCYWMTEDAGVALFYFIFRFGEMLGIPG